MSPCQENLGRGSKNVIQNILARNHTTLMGTVTEQIYYEANPEKRKFTAHGHIRLTQPWSWIKANLPQT